MIWDYFIYFSLAAVTLWTWGAWAAWRGKRLEALWTTSVGIVVFFAYILLLWHSLERPPLRTMGETRLWYSLLLPIAGVVVYGRWRYRWMLTFSTMLATVFACVNLFRPELHTKNLMPALQSPWFAPHVIVYMMAYALLGAAFVMAVYLLFFKRNGTPSDKEMQMTDRTVLLGYAFLTLGILMGALWAKEAWGHYWSWDPKETWAAVTWLTYLIYIHYRHASRQTVHGTSRSEKFALWMLVAGFCLLQMCWWGINYLPSAAGGIHTYSMQ